MRIPVDPARKPSARPRQWRAAKALMFELHGSDCWICGHPGGYEADHLVRLVDGGAPYDVENIRPAHGANYPCPVCVNVNTGAPRCCNQERNGKRMREQRRTTLSGFSVDPDTL